MHYGRLPTEQTNPKTQNLDLLNTRHILGLINREDQNLSQALKAVLPTLERTVEIIVSALREGRKLILAGAGTSGRLAVMEAAECPVTFQTKPWQIQAVMAGGRKAVFRSQEGAEDSAAAGEDLIRRRARPGDVILGIAASGVTPFVLGALETAKRLGCRTILLTCHHSARSTAADITIAMKTGPEVIAGSTRMKAGTATKMALNMITTASMVRLGKVYQNRMVDLEIKSRKLRERAIRLVAEIAEVSRPSAEKYLAAAGGKAKTAIVMSKKKVSKSQALELLNKHRGFLRPLIK